MNIIICGAGRVGFTIAKQLSEQGHSITVIDPSSEDIQKIDDALDVKAIVGKGTYPSILEKANAAETDMIIAVTRNDEINMLICQIAFSIFNIPKKIARIRSQDYLNPKFTRVYNKENLPIDVIISPEIEIAKSIQRKLEAPGALDSVPFSDNKIRLLEILVKDNCKLIDFKLEFGRIKINGRNEVILADEISPDTCRLWDSITDKKLDKDRFRKDLGNLIPAYTEVAKRLGILHEQSNVSAVNVTKLSSVKKKNK